jgi:hypothetical protein
MRLTVDRPATHAETAAEMDRRGKIIEQLETDNARLTARVAELETENASLASWQCEFTDGKTGLVCAEGGGTYCAMARRVAELEAALVDITGAGEEAWGPDRPCVKIARAALSQPAPAVGTAQTSRGIQDNEPVVIYRGKDGSWWARPQYEFNDGRFETLPPPPEKGGE